MKWSGFLAVHNKSISLRRKARPDTTEEVNESFSIIDCRSLFSKCTFHSHHINIRSVPSDFIPK